MIPSLHPEQTKYRAKTNYKKLLADTVTPVSIYLRLRDRYANSILLESSDYHGSENSFSYICCQPIARFEVKQQTITQEFPDGKHATQKVNGQENVLGALHQFINQFEVPDTPFDFINNGLFGYCSYDAVRYFEDIDINTYNNDQRAIPDVLYQAYQFVIAINHFKNELYIFEHQYDERKSKLDILEAIVVNNNIPSYQFHINGPETTNMTDDTFLDIVQKGKDHCQRGDVFQIVLARRFTQGFQGDEFNVYRTLRSINPSPYLFYFDYGSFKIFGSSPEAQLVIKDNKASIHPIAGTFKRTGDDKADREAATALFNDPKENAEHVMLVDLARNDLSRNGDQVNVEVFKEIQYYSHVIHLVSKVTANIHEQDNPLKIIGDTFPAGTLSGAPKHKAMQLINQYEGSNRGYYGGCIGFLGFNGSFNQAIMIRSFLSKNNALYFQAGAGIVSKSDPKSELEEVHNKLRALRTALTQAERL